MRAENKQNVPHNQQRAQIVHEKLRSEYGRQDWTRKVVLHQRIEKKSKEIQASHPSVMFKTSAASRITNRKWYDCFS